MRLLIRLGVVARPVTVRVSTQTRELAEYLAAFTAVAFVSLATLAVVGAVVPI